MAYYRIEFPKTGIAEGNIEKCVTALDMYLNKIYTINKEKISPIGKEFVELSEELARVIDKLRLVIEDLEREYQTFKDIVNTYEEYERKIAGHIDKSKYTSRERFIKISLPEMAAETIVTSIFFGGVGYAASFIESGVSLTTPGVMLSAEEAALLNGGTDFVIDNNFISSEISINLNPSEVRFSQTSVNGSEDIISSMQKNGWAGDPIDVVLMEDGHFTTIDNTRLISARRAGIEVKATVHNYSDPLPIEYIERFTTKKGQPITWGEAMKLRIGKQSATFRRNYPMGAPNIINRK